MVLIEAVSLAFSYPTSPDALFDDLGFSIHSDSRIGLVGQNGSGKSTLLRLLRGSLEPQAGKLLSARGLEIGWLPQDSGEAWEEGPEKAAPFSEGGFRRIAVSLDLDPGIREKPFRSLSGGEKTKLALARLLAAEPGFLLLDEPTNYLDSASRAAAAKLLAAGGNALPRRESRPEVSRRNRERNLGTPGGTRCGLRGELFLLPGRAGTRLPETARGPRTDKGGDRTPRGSGSA